MKNKKGFTLTEILATIVILGIILAIAVPSYNALSKKFEKEYYDKLDKSVLAAAKSYWKDNPDKRPNKLLMSDHIKLDDLIKEKHIENVTEYKDKKSLKGYIIIINVGNGKYDYKTCIENDSKTWMSWNEDEAKNNNNINNYCNVKWLANDVNYNTITDDRVYLYVDEDYEMNENNSNELRKKLGTSKVASVTDSDGQTLKKITIADGKDNKVYPENVTAVTLNDKGKFKLQYSNGTRELNVFKYDAPIVSTEGNKVTLKVNDDNKNLMTDLDLTTSKYQQYVKGKWEDISCEGTKKEECTISYRGTGTLDIKYRFIDNDTVGNYRLTGERDYGNISNESEIYTINLTTSELSFTPHIGSIKGPNYNGEWINKDVYFQIEGKNIKLAYRTSLNGNWKEEKSIPESIKATVKKDKVLNTTYQFADASGKSEHSKENPLEYSVKIDKIKPTIEVKIYDTNGNEHKTGLLEWTNKDLVLVAKVEDKHSGIKKVRYNLFGDFDEYEGDNNSRIYTTLLNSSTSSVTIEATDNAGNTARKTINVKIDKLKPQCSITNDSNNNKLKATIVDLGGSGIVSKGITPSLNEEKCSEGNSIFENVFDGALNILNLKTCYKYTKAGMYTLTVQDGANNTSVCQITTKGNNSTTSPKEDLSKPIITLSSASQTSSDVTFSLTNPNNTGTLYYSFDKNNWVEYPNGNILLINWTGSRKVYAYVKGTTTKSETSEATGYCNKDGVWVTPNALEGTYFKLKFTLPNNPSGVTNGKYEYIYWGAVATNDTENKQSSQTNKCNLTKDLINKRKTITTPTTEKLYMKHQRQYYCFAVRPYRNKEITEINRWTIQRKHAKTVGTINSSNYNGVE